MAKQRGGSKKNGGETSQPRGGRCTSEVEAPKARGEGADPREWWLSMDGGSSNMEI